MAYRRSSHAALILVDVINHFEFPDGGKLLRNCMRIAPAVIRLKARAKAAGVPVIYVNDNFSHWRSDARQVFQYCTRVEAPGRQFVQSMSPDEDDYFVLKPMHSAFYQTPLDTLLRFLGSSSIILAGVSTDSCVTYSAHDAKMRALPFLVPSDCCAARSAVEHERALDHIRNITGADVVPSRSISFMKRKGKP